MIYITCGTCGTSLGYKTSADGELSLPAAEEARLVSRGVAAYVTKPVIDPDSGITAGGKGEDSAGGGNTRAETDRPSKGPEDGGNEIEYVLNVVDGHFTAESLMKQTRAQLESMAERRGMDIAGCRTKGDIVALLSGVEVRVGGETPPELGAEAPVV